MFEIWELKIRISLVFSAWCLGFIIKNMVPPMIIIQQLISDFWNLFLNIFFPKYCVGCGQYGSFLCFSCAKNIENVRTGTCYYCGRITKDGKTCPACRQRERSILAGIILSAGYEGGPVKEMIHHLKYNGILEFADMLGELMVERLRRKVPKGEIVVVPVPLHRNRQGQRGFNQSELLARYVSKKLKLPGGLALSKVVNTDPQVGKSGVYRKSNIQSAFRVEDKGLIEGKTVLLIDDVATTGSTLNECAKVLKSAGAKSVWGVVAARG